MHALLLILALSASFVPPEPLVSYRLQPVEGLVNIRFQVDVRVFAAMAAINIAGFNLDAESLQQNPTRRLVLERLRSVDPNLRDRLREFYQARNSENDDAKQQSKYISLALLLAAPPQFALSVKAQNVPPDAQSVAGFERLLEELWRQGQLPKLWEEVRADYLREVEAYRPLIRSMILDILRYMRTEARVALDRQVTFIPDLLNGYGIVNARNIAGDYIVLAGPSRTGQKLMRSVRHEYLHFLLDPLLAKYRGYWPEEEPYLRRAQAQPRVREQYANDFPLLLTESLLRMVELRLDAKGGGSDEQEIVTAYEQGLVLAPYFEAELRRFEGRRDALQEFFQSLIEGISWEVEGRRDAATAELRERLAARSAKARAREHSQAQSSSEIRSLLTQANQFLLAREFDRARQVLEKILQLEPLNPNALFGLAQTAAQSQEIQRALDLYQQAAANCGDETWIAAWSFLHRGNLYRFMDDLSSARAEWSKVLNLQGDLRGAREAASKALGKN